MQPGPQWFSLLLVFRLVGAHDDVCTEEPASNEASLLQSNLLKNSLVVSPSGEEIHRNFKETPHQSQVFERGGSDLKEFIQKDVNDIPHYSLLEMSENTRTHSISAMQRAVSKRYQSYQAHSAHLRRSANGFTSRLLEIAAKAGEAAAAVERAVAVDDVEHSSESGPRLLLLSEALHSSTEGSVKQSSLPKGKGKSKQKVKENVVAVKQFFLPDKGKGKNKIKHNVVTEEHISVPTPKNEESQNGKPERPEKHDDKVSSLAELVDKFIDSQSNSEDACHAQLLEAKNQLNSLRELVTDLVQEVNTTEKAMILYDKELQEKLQKLADIQAWKDDQLKKCKKKKEEDIKMFLKLSEELKEMEQIASPDVSMNVSAKTLHNTDQDKDRSSNEASLLQVDASALSIRHRAAQKLTTIPRLMDSTRRATLVYNRCMETRVELPDPESLSLLQGENGTSVPEECKEQKKLLEKTYVKTYVELTRLQSQYDKLSKDTACEETIDAVYAEQHEPLRESTERLSKVSGETAKNLNEIKPQLEKAEWAEGKLRIQVKRLTEQCGQLGITVSDLDRVRDVIRSLSDCPGLSRVEFLVPKWTGKWVSFTQDSEKKEDKETDSDMDSSCTEASPGSRAAEVGEIEERTIQDIPLKLNSPEPLLGACPNCEGEEDQMYKSGHARICWENGSSLDLQGESQKCGKGKKVILCVIDRGSIRSVPR